MHNNKEKRKCICKQLMPKLCQIKANDIKRLPLVFGNWPKNKGVPGNTITKQRSLQLANHLGKVHII